MSNVDTVPETDAQVDKILDAATAELTTEAPAQAPTGDGPAPTLTPYVPAQRPTRTGNSAYAPEADRERVKGIMDELRAAGYTRPEISHYTGFNDSQVWRAQNGKVHTVELDTWLPFFKLFAEKQLPPANSASRKPKPEALQARIVELEATLAARVTAVTEVLTGEAKTVAQYRRLIEAAQAALNGEAAPVESTEVAPSA